MGCHSEELGDIALNPSRVHASEYFDLLRGMRGPRCRLEREAITSSRLVQVVSIQFDCAKRSTERSKWFKIEDPSDR